MVNTPWVKRDGNHARSDVLALSNFVADHIDDHANAFLFPGGSKAVPDAAISAAGSSATWFTQCSVQVAAQLLCVERITG